MTASTQEQSGVMLDGVAGTPIEFRLVFLASFAVFLVAALIGRLPLSQGSMAAAVRSAAKAVASRTIPVCFIR